METDNDLESYDSSKKDPKIYSDHEISLTRSAEKKNYGSVVRPRRVNRIGNINVRDHFSLSNPSSTVAFADDEAIVFVDNLEQVTLHKDNEKEYLTAKQATVSSPGLLLTRSFYTVVALLMTGFVFIFCIQIVLFLFLGLAIESGKKKLCYSSSSRLS